MSYKHFLFMSTINSYRDLIVYQKAYKLAMEIFEISKDFPKEEKYSLIDQIRRSSRSIQQLLQKPGQRNNILNPFSAN